MPEAAASLRIFSPSLYVAELVRSVGMDGAADPDAPGCRKFEPPPPAELIPIFGVVVSKEFGQDKRAAVLVFRIQGWYVLTTGVDLFAVLELVTPTNPRG